MTKLEIVTNLYEKLGFSRRECANIVDAFFDVIKKTLAEEENVKISGFGNFIVKQKKARVSKVSPETMAALVAHRWPGNVRELENVIYRSAVIAQGDAILVKDLPVEIRAATGTDAGVARAPGGDAAPDSTLTAVAESPAQANAKIAAETTASGAPALSVEQALDFLHTSLRGGEEPILPRVERELIARALAAENGDVAKAAKQLGLTKAVLQKRLTSR